MRKLKRDIIITGLLTVIAVLGFIIIQIITANKIGYVFEEITLDDAQKSHINLTYPTFVEDVQKLQGVQSVSNSVTNINEVDTNMFSEEDEYMLAKIAMCEAGNQSTKTKALIISTILNRVEDSCFPNTISEVIFQERNGVYQFTPIIDGSWEKNEPNQDCWEALEIVKQNEEDLSKGALYFEAHKTNNSWHSRNLKFLYKSESVRFYK